MISSIFACIFREAIISVLTERAPLRRSLNRADAEKARWSRAVAAITETLWETRFVTSCFFLENKKLLWGSTKVLNVAKLATLHAFSTTHLFLSVWLQQHTWRICQRAHTHTGISGPRPIRGGVCPSLSLIGLDHDISLTGVSFVEPQSFWVADTFFSLLEWLDAPVQPWDFC